MAEARYVVVQIGESLHVKDTSPPGRLLGDFHPGQMGQANAKALMDEMNRKAGPVEFDGCTVKRSTIERIEVVGPMPVSGGVYDRLVAMGYRVTRSGPYTDRKMHPKVDKSRFLYVAEREAER